MKGVLDYVCVCLLEEAIYILNLQIGSENITKKIAVLLQEMKRLFFISILIAVMVGCNDDYNDKIEYIKGDGTLFGTWRQTETFYHNGAEGGWKALNDGYTYTFNKDSTFTSNRFSEFEYGTFSLSETELTLNFGCGNLDSYIETVLFREDHIILKPTYLNCFEGCGEKFRKISDSNK